MSPLPPSTGAGKGQPGQASRPPHSQEPKADMQKMTKQRAFQRHQVTTLSPHKPLAQIHSEAASGFPAGTSSVVL